MTGETRQSSRELLAWAEENKIGDLIEKLIEGGYSNLEVVKHVERSDLAELGIHKSGDVKRILLAVGGPDALRPQSGIKNLFQCSLSFWAVNVASLTPTTKQQIRAITADLGH